MIEPIINNAEWCLCIVFAFAAGYLTGLVYGFFEGKDQAKNNEDVRKILSTRF